MNTDGNIDEAPILLHTCCAPCATASIERLQNEGCAPVLFFSNSNISPKLEYDKRLENTRRLADRTGCEIIEDKYDHDSWLENISQVPGYADEPEGGARCAQCFRYSFHRAWEKMTGLGLSFFTTSLSISPYKNSALLFRVGGEFQGFRDFDFKKQDGYKRSIELSREYSLYRQTYCGCEFSRSGPAK